MAMTSGLSIKRIATYQKYTVPLVVLSDTAQQTARPLQEGMIRGSLDAGHKAILVCMDSVSDFSQAIVNDMRIAVCDNFAADPASIQKKVLDQICQLGKDSPVLVVIDNLERLLHSSRVRTLSMLRAIRRSLVTLAAPKSRMLVCYPRDMFEDITNSLCELADATIGVYPLSAQETWMPGWYSTGKPVLFISLSDNDSRRGLVRLEHKRQSGKVGLEVASFELNDSLVPVFSPIAIAPAKLSTASSEPLQPTDKAQAKKKQEQHQNITPSSQDPTANLPFNLNLTDRQRRDKAKVELPYLEAQVEDMDLSGPHSSSANHGGGEIHYQLDEEDDWDEDDPDDDLEI